MCFCVTATGVSGSTAVQNTLQVTDQSGHALCSRNFETLHVVKDFWQTFMYKGINRCEKYPFDAR